MLTLVGLGLYDFYDITLRGLKAIEEADFVFAEMYTSRLIGESIEDFERKTGKRITVLDREIVESGKELLDLARDNRVVLLVVGDPMAATTHLSLRLMAEEMGVETRVIHNASIITAAPGLMGLQHYKFGRIVSLPFPHENYFPTSAYDFIEKNQAMGLHTLVLLDINPRPMTANEAMEILLKMEDVKKRGVIKDNTLIGVIARAGAPDCLVRAGFIGDLIKEDFGPPLHSLIIPGTLHFAEAEALVRLAGAPSEIMEE